MTMTTVMTPNMERWLDVLSTTDLPQAKGTLIEKDKDGNLEGMCCLGVWCDMAQREGLTNMVEEQKENPSDGNFIRTHYDGEAGVLPYEAAKALGMPNNPRVVVKNPHYDPDSDSLDVYEYPPGDDPETSNNYLYRTSNPEYLLHEQVASLNDDGLTFSQIADLIRFAGGVAYDKDYNPDIDCDITISLTHSQKFPYSGEVKPEVLERLMVQAEEVNVNTNYRNKHSGEER